MENKKVSIIIPAYNVENYIFRALESCINQSYKNIEILVIDDGSVDKTNEVVKKYILRDKRIRYFWQENSGVSKARNTGILNSEGNYIIFLDSDDWIENVTIEYMLKKQKENEEYFVMANRKCITIDGKVFQNEENGNIEKLKKEKILQNFIVNNYRVASSCYKLFSKKILKDNNIKFKEDIFHGEDGLFVFEYLLHIEDILYINKCLWNILQRPNSASREKKFNRKLFTAITAVEKMIELSKGNKKLEEKMRAYLAFRTIGIYLKGIEYGTLDEKEINCLKSKLKKNKKYFYKENKLKSKIKYFIILNIPMVIIRNLIRLKNKTSN